MSHDPVFAVLTSPHPPGDIRGALDDLRPMVSEAHRVFGAGADPTLESVAGGSVDVSARHSPQVIPPLAQTAMCVAETPFEELTLWVSAPDSDLFSRMPAGAGGMIGVHYGPGSPSLSAYVRSTPSPDASDVSLRFPSVRPRSGDLANILEGALIALGLEDQRRALHREIAGAGPGGFLRGIRPVEAGDLFSTELRRGERGGVGFFVRTEMPPSEAAAALARLPEHAPSLTLDLLSFKLDPATLVDDVHVIARVAPDALLSSYVEAVWPVDVVGEVAAHTLDLNLYVFLRRFSPNGYAGLRLSYGAGDRGGEPGSPASAWDHDGRVRLELLARDPTADERRHNARRLASFVAPWLPGWGGVSKLTLP